MEHAEAATTLLSPNAFWAGVALLGGIGFGYAMTGGAAILLAAPFALSALLAGPGATGRWRPSLTGSLIGIVVGALIVLGP